MFPKWLRWALVKLNSTDRWRTRQIRSSQASAPITIVFRISPPREHRFVEVSKFLEDMICLGRVFERVCLLWWYPTVPFALTGSVGSIPASVLETVRCGWCYIDAERISLQLKQKQTKKRRKSSSLMDSAPLSRLDDSFAGGIKEESRVFGQPHL